MKTLSDLIDRCERAGIQLRVEGDRLCYDAPRAAITAEIRAELASRSREIVTFLGAARALPPTDIVELRLVQVCEAALGRRPVGIQESLARHGGDLTRRVIAEMRRSFHVEMEPADLAANPTIQLFAGAVRTRVAPAPWSPLLPIQPDGGGVPLFCVHPVGGDSLTYQKLAFHLGPERPLFGLQARGLSDAAQSHSTIEEMASCYVEALRTFRGLGPWLLAGWSLGGLVAYEMAQQLVQSEPEPPLVVLIATHTPALLRARLARMDLAEVFRKRSGIRIELPDAMRERGEYEQTTYLHEEAIRQGLLPNDGYGAVRRLLATNDRAMMAYVPKPYPGRTVVLCPAQDGERTGDETLGWGAVAGPGLEAHMVPGGHPSCIFEPHVAVLAERIRGLLPPAEREATASGRSARPVTRDPAPRPRETRGATASIADLLDRCARADIRLTTDGDRLRFDGPRGALTSELRAELVASKQELLRALAPNAADPGASGVRRVPRDRPLPLSLAQQRIWVMDRIDADVALFNLGVLRWRISGRLEPDAFCRSVDEIVARHEVLRTVFPLAGGEVSAVIRPAARETLVRLDLAGLSEGERASAVEQLAREHVEHRFDLAKGPLLLGHLVRTGEEEHVVFLTAHHIVIDGTSLGTFMAELAAHYRALTRGGPPLVRPLPVQYVDYAAWQREWLGAGRLDAGLRYWTRKLAGAPPVLELPADRPRPARQSYRGRVAPFLVSADRATALKALARRAGATPFMAFVAVFAALLRLYTGQEDLVLGTPTSDRQRSELEPLIGLFLNTVALRIDLSGDPSFLELLAWVRQVCLEAYAHRDVPFEQIIEALQPERNTSHSPVFQVMIVSRDVQAKGTEKSLFPAIDGMAIEHVANPRERATQYDLTLSMIEADGRLQGEVEYSADLFEDRTIARLLTHLEALLDGIVADPIAPLSRRSLLTREEREQALRWNPAPTAYSSDRCVHELFEAQARCTPGAVALEWRGAEITYAELDARANRLARRLTRGGMRREERIGLAVERSPELVVALLAILKAGGAYVPVDPRGPPERLDYMIRNAGVRVVVTEGQFVERFADDAAKAIRVDEAAAYEIVDGVGADPGVARAVPDQLAYVMYTSGSTGSPKGVQVTHRSVVNLLEAVARTVGLRACDRLLAVTPVTFDISVLELLTPLFVGGRVILASREEAADGKALAEKMERTGTTAMQATPATWRLLLSAGWSGRPHLKILCGGEALPRELSRALVPRGEAVWNLYGPTETTIWSLASQVQAGDGDAGGVEWIGRPLANTVAYVVDERLEPVPVGVAGELCLGGVGVARGYLRRPDLTAERFVPDPFGPPGARLYRTGDLARYRSDGVIEYLGRRDQQVKVRGFRIELGEIEAALTAHPAVRESVVVVRGERDEDKELVAYVVRTGGDDGVTAELVEIAKRKLPAYMVPARFVFVDAVPLTPNGKVDRKALAAGAERAWAPPAGEAAGARDRSPAGRAPPRGDVEDAVAAAWREVLGVAEVGVHDNFFDVGGNSFRIIQVHDKLSRTVEPRLAVMDLFQHPTIASLARFIEAGRAERRRGAPADGAGGAEARPGALVSGLGSRSEDE